MKQIVAMFLSANPPSFGEANPELRQYVMNTETVGLPAQFRVHTALTGTRLARQAA